MSSVQERLATAILTRSSHAAIDPMTIAIIIQVILQVMQQLQACYNNPDPQTVRLICRKPTGVQWFRVYTRLRWELGRDKFQELGGANLVNESFNAVLDISDADVAVLLQQSA